jgi:endonuclease/exonuclease/phosphatase family metal-dependent hydrolase
MYRKNKLSIDSKIHKQLTTKLHDSENMKIKLMTYNIHRAIGLDRRFKPERIVEIINDIKPDIALLQEVDEGVPRSRELNLAKEVAQLCGFKHYKLGHNVSLKKGYYGNATLSKFPISKERNINLTIDNKKRRGCQHTTINITKNNLTIPVEVFNLHLGLSAKERQKQAGILSHCEEYLSIQPNSPCIVAGDFNDWRSLLRALFIEGLGFECATDSTKRWGESAIKTYPSFAPRGGLDRVYYKGKMDFIKAKRYDKNSAMIASDHLPIVVEFELS